MSCPLQFRIATRLSFTVAVITITSACYADTPFKDYLEQLHDLRQQNKLIDLCDWLSELHVADLTSLAADDELSFQEAFLFEAADTFDVEANRLKSSSQAATTYAEKSLAVWRAYVDWYSRLLPKTADRYSSRARAATAHLGEALLLMNRSDDAVQAYEELDPDYIGNDAFGVWRKALLAASVPSMAKPTICKTAICQPGWNEHWQKYSETLKIFASRLKERLARAPNNEAHRIDTIVASCDQSKGG